MIINYVHCQMLPGSNKQASEFTVLSSLLKPVNPVWVTGLNKVAPSPEQKPPTVHVRLHHWFFFFSQCLWPKQKNTLSRMLFQGNSQSTWIIFYFFNKILYPTRAKFGLKSVDFLNCIFWIDGLPRAEMKTTVASWGIFISKYIFQKKK